MCLMRVNDNPKGRANAYCLVAMMLAIHFTTSLVVFDDDFL